MNAVQDILPDRIPYHICPLCESANHQHYANGDMRRSENKVPGLDPYIEWRRCECSHIFTAGYHTEEAKAKLLAGSLDCQQVGADFERLRFVLSRDVDAVVPYADRGLWVDVGFGSGALLALAQEYGYDPLGLDIRQQNVDDLNSIGIPARCCDLESLISEPIDVISMTDVLEHIPFPRTVLTAAHFKLREGGVLYLSTPNAGSFLWEAYNATENPYIDEIEHYHVFSRSRLYDLLRNMGFEPMKFGINPRYKCGMSILAVKI